MSTSNEGKKYLWHLSNERWEAAMEVIEDDALVHPKTIKQAHEKFLAERGHKNRGKSAKKSGKMSKRTEEQ